MRQSIHVIVPVLTYKRAVRNVCCDFHSDTRITDKPCLVQCRLRAVEFHRCFRSGGPCCVPLGSDNGKAAVNTCFLHLRPNLLDSTWAFRGVHGSFEAVGSKQRD